MQIVLMIVVAVLVFGAVIFVHELGHFVAAKRSGILVLEFSLGMGPCLLRIQRGDTQYSLRALPIGGFVMMEGEDEESDKANSFRNASIPKRIIVIVAGAVMNMVLGFLALVLLVATGGDIASKTVSRVYDEGTGLKVGDEILRVNGRPCYVINDMFYEFARTQNGNFDLTVRREGEKLELKGVSFPVKTATDAETGEVILDERTGEPYEYLDVGFAVLPIERNVGSVLREAGANTLSYARLIYRSLFDLIAGRAQVNELSGPVGIVSEIGRAVSIGWQPVVEMLALISVNLGIVNMLPLPALDGGKTLLLILEGIRRKPIRQKYETAINLVGFALLMGIMVMVSFNDIARLVA